MQLDSLNYQNRLTFFPSQKLSSDKKDDKWAISCIEAASNLTLVKNDFIRQSQHNKKVNYNLANDIIDEKEIHKVFNPMGFQSGEFPAAIMHYNVSMSKINVLVGEESARKFDWKAVCLNEEVQADKNTLLLGKLFETAQRILAEGEVDEKKIQEKLKELDKYMRYTYRDVRELTANRILKYLEYEQKLLIKFNKGFEDLLIAGEEIYRVDIIGDNPVVERVNPLHLFTLRNGVSPYLEDAEIIIELGYCPIGRVQDEFYDELTEKEVEYIESGYNVNSVAGNNLLHARSFNPVMNVSSFFNDVDDSNMITIDDNATRIFGGWFNEQGEVRVMRVRWKSRLKRYKRKYYDEDGDVQFDIVSEYYKADKDAGEELEEIWINEWWEGTKIADNIYTKMRPRPVQFRNMSNPAKCSSGYVGTYANINSSKALGLMDRMKPFQYLYNIFMRRFELAFAKYKFPILQLNQTLKPDNWDTDKWLYYANEMGVLLVDPFNEGQHGSATGKLAGTMNTMTNDFLNPQMGNFIQLHVQALQYIEDMLAKISGVSPQREAQISTNESVGGVERSVTQSSHMTEKWFMIHEDTKRRVYEALLETAKHVYKGKKNKSVPYILDDMQIALMEIDTDQFNESQYNIHISNASQDNKIYEALQQLSQASLQNGGSLSMIIDIMKSNSISEISRKLKDDEEQKRADAKEQQESEQKQATQMQQMQQELAEKQLQVQLAEKEKDRELEREKMQLNLQIETMKLEVANQPVEEEDTSLDDEIRLQEMELKRLNIEIANEGNANKLSLERDKLLQEKAKLQEEIRKNKALEDLKEKEIVVKRIAANKKPTNKK